MRKLLLGLFFGLLSQAALAQAPSSLPGCQYLATPPTLSDKQTSVWQCDINGKLITSGGGNVVGPASSTDNALARWDGTTGQLLQDSTVIVGDAATGTIRFGAALDAAAPVAQTLGVQSVVAGTANTAGANFTIAGSKSTGSAAGGSIIFQTAAAGGAGSSQNALATALTIGTTGTVSVGNASPAVVAASGALSVAGASGQTLYLGVGISTFGLQFRMDSSGLRAANTHYIGWSSDTTSFGTADVTLYRDAANTLALRNSTTAQTFRIYNSYTDGSNYERLNLTWSANIAYLTTVSAGGAGDRSLAIGAGGNNLYIGSGGLYQWQITNGNLIAATDNTNDIGASGATRPRSGYFGTNLTTGNDLIVGQRLYVTGSTNSFIYSNGDGSLAFYNNAATDFGALQLGGTTSSFPAIRRNGVKIEAKLADNSTYTSFAARGLIVAGAVPTLALAGGTCAGTVIAGGSTAGTVTLTGVCVATNTMALTVMPTAPTGYACDAIDRTLGSSLLTETATTTTSVTFTFGGTTGATDVLAYKCLAY